jgi:Fe-S cluster assembly ATP-binding protein
MLTITGLTVCFQDRPVIKNLSLTIAPGTTHALMGANGSGKSTLASALMGFPQYEIISGSCSFEGEELCGVSSEQRARAGLFLAPQQPPAIPGVQVFTFLKEAHRMLTKEDISVPAFKDLVYEAFDKVKLDHSFVYRNVHEGFSGGEKKRFEIAQMLLFKPRVAILDEIDSGLDVDALKQISKVLKNEQEKRPLSLLMITHYRRLLDYVMPEYVHLLSQGILCRTGDYSLAQRIDAEGYDGLSL